MHWAGLAIGIGALIVVTRAPLVVRPAETLDLYRRLLATNARARALGVLYLAMAIACLAAAADTGGAPRQILFLLVVVFSATTVWTTAAPAHFRGFVDGWFRFIETSVDPAAVRGLGMLGVGFGGLLIWWGVGAL